MKHESFLCLHCFTSIVSTSLEYIYPSSQLFSNFLLPCPSSTFQQFNILASIKHYSITTDLYRIYPETNTLDQLKMSLSKQLSVDGPFDLNCETFFPNLPAPTSRPKTLGLEHSKFAKFFLIQFSSPLPGNDFHISSTPSNNDLQPSSPLSSDNDLPSRSLFSGDNIHFSLPLSENDKHKPAPVALGMPNSVAFKCQAVHGKVDVQETRFGKINYSSIGLI